MRTNTANPTLRRIAEQVVRVAGAGVSIRMDEEFEPAAGPLIEVAIGGAFWHLYPDQFLALLKEMPDHAGADAVKQAIESNAQHVWHGPAPPSRESNDTT